MPCAEQAQKYKLSTGHGIVNLVSVTQRSVSMCWYIYHNEDFAYIECKIILLRVVTGKLIS